MSDAADAPPHIRGSYARVTYFEPLLDADLLPIRVSGMSPRADGWVDAVQLYGKLIRHGVVRPAAGTGKSRVLEAILRSALVFSDAKAILDEAQGQRATADLTRRLLSTAEKDTRLPSITTLANHSTAIWASGPVPTSDELAAASEAVTQFWLVAMDLLSEHISSGRYARDSHAPRQGSSPCGVIGLSAPRVPRAPGGPADLPAPSHMCVLAA
jgi:hypothetical protein